MSSTTIMLNGMAANAGQLNFAAKQVKRQIIAVPDVEQASNTPERSLSMADVLTHCLSAGKKTDHTPK